MIKHYTPYRSDFYTALKVPTHNIRQGSEHKYYPKGVEISVQTLVA